MGKSCAIIPKVKNKDGQIVDSRLFNNLLAYTGNNREEAVRIYHITKNAEFIKNWNPILTMDENNEPTISSLLRKTNLSNIIPSDKVLSFLNRRIGYYKKNSLDLALYTNNDKNYRKLVEKAIEFNTKSDFKDDFVASVEKVISNDSNKVYIAIRVQKKDRMNSLNASKMEYNYNLNNKLRAILEEKGISVGVLTELEERLGVNGVTDFDVAREAGTGFVELIRLADGIRGEKALPEEFAHAALRMMIDTPLVSRLINFIDSKGLTNEILGEEFDEYNSMYQGNTAKLAEEAAGKLLAKHLLQAEPIVNKPYKSLLQRVIDAVKSFLRNLSASKIQRAILEADKEFSTLATDILAGHMTDKMNADNLKGSGQLYQINNLNERVQRDKKILRDIINNELKRLKIYERRNPNSKFGTKQRILIDKLETDLLENNEIEGIYSFLDHALEELTQVNTRFITLRETSGATIQEKAKLLRDIRNYIYSYEDIIEDIRTVLLNEERYADNRYGDRVRVALDNAANLIRDAKSEYREISMPLFVEFIRPFLGQNVVVPFGKHKGEVIKAEDIVKQASEDISFFDRWLDSMSDSSNYMLKIMGNIVVKSKGKARLSTIEMRKKIESAKIKLEQAGVKDTAWMFERDADGKRTGNYITEINYGEYRKQQRALYKRLKEKYGENPTDLEDIADYKAEESAWYNDNTERLSNGTSRPKLSIYGNPEFPKEGTAKREFYDTIMGIKKELDSYLPDDYTKLTSTIKIRKDLLERVKQSDSVKSGATEIWESIKDEFIRRTDDTDFGDKAAIKDFEGREVQMLPVYYTKLKEGESEEDISTDVTSTMIAYAAMANDFNEMNKIIDVLELGRDVMRDNFKIDKTSGGKPVVERFQVLGRKIENKLTKPDSDRRVIERLNDFFEMQVYGRYMKDEGTFGKTNIDKGKVANFVNRVTSLNTLAINVLSGISNVATGKVMMRIESIAGEFFNEKNTIIADKNYGKALPEFLAEIGNRVKTSKLALWDELFDVMQDYESDVREANFDRKTWVSRMYGTSTLFFMNNAGEHWMQNRTSLALADSYKMKAPDGKIISLWDAMEVKYIDEKNHSLGATLEIKEGYTKEDGSAFTKEDIIKFSRKAAIINQKMHGIYNKIDRNAFQKLAIGRMGMMFRKWIKPSLNRRFKSLSYNYDLEEWSEGYYNTTGRFLLQLGKELRNAQFNLITDWKNLDPREKANIRRAITEVAHFLLIAGILAMIEWSDDKNRSWIMRMLEYQLRRLYTEIGTMIPGKPMVSEGLRIIKSPAAGVNTLEDALNLTKIFNPFNWTDELQSGRYKGHSTAYKSFWESPIVPMSRTVYRGLHPEAGIPFYKQ